MDALELLIEDLQRRLKAEKPNVVFIHIARMMMDAFGREDLPDWVEALANGDPDKVAEVVEVALEDIRAEEVERGR